MTNSELLFLLCNSTFAINRNLLSNYLPSFIQLINNSYVPPASPNPLRISSKSFGNLSFSNVFSDPLNEFNSFLDKVPKNSAVIIPLSGPMFKDDSFCFYGTETISELIISAAKHPSVSSIIIKCHSPGGTVDSIAPLLYAKDVVKAMNKTIIGFGDQVSSAAYYFLSSLDLIIASNNISANFGSIGVMANFVDTQPVQEKAGVKFHEVYPPESNFKNLPFNQALKGKYNLLIQEHLSPLAIRFKEDVRNNRKGKINLSVKGILAGRDFNANDALKHGLIDFVGNINFAISKANNRS